MTWADLGRHHQEVTRLLLACVPVGVGRAACCKNSASSVRDHLTLAETEAQLSLEHVPSLVVCVVHVKRGDPTGADLRRPFHDHEVAAPKTERNILEPLDARHPMSIPHHIAA